MSESRRLVNARAKRDLRWRLRYPTPAALLAGMASAAPAETESVETPAGRRARSLIA
jgi:hypothetical protein